MLAAAVRMARTHGIPALVVVAPIPWDTLRAEGFADVTAVRQRIDAIRTAIRAIGGTPLVDLHRALGHGDFRDLGGHYTRQGARKLATTLEHWVRLTLLTARPAAAPD